MWRKMEALRDRIMHGVGTDEPWIQDPHEFQAETGRTPIAVHWRKPLKITEAARMAPIPEVRQRPGRA